MVHVELEFRYVFTADVLDTLCDTVMYSSLDIAHY